MHDTDRFARLLKIKAPWRVSLVEQDEATLTLTIHLRLDADARLRCPTCGKLCPRYDHRRRRWRHLDTMQFNTIVEADVPRVTCHDHGVILLGVPWAEDASRYTALFERMVISWLKDASTSAVARNLRLSWSAVDGIMNRAVARGLARRTVIAPKHLSIDETSFQRRHEYVTVVTDQTTGAILYLADDRTKDALAEYFHTLSPQDCAGIASVSMDMWQAYINVVGQYVPDAERKTCFDKFHVAQKLGDGVDRTRRAENKALRAAGDESLCGTKYLWLVQPKNMPSKHLPTFRQLRDSALKTAEAWALREHAMSLWNYVSPTWARKAWEDWIALTEASALEPMRTVATTI